VGVKVTAPDGREWSVSRSIRWPRYRKTIDADWLDAPLVNSAGDLPGIVGVIVVGVLAAILIVALLPVLALVLEALLVVVATLFLRRAWVVTARSTNPPEERAWRVRGLFRSRSAVREVADELQRGVRAAPEHALR
jgi:hypothetical protein